MKWVLVVDDDPMLLEVISGFLEGCGARVTTASDAMQAFIQARDLKPALVISDIQMPQYGTGDAALRELRKDPRLRGIPFIFMTGMALDKAAALLPKDDPTVRLMGKPLDFDKLAAWVKELAGIEISGGGGTPP